MSENGERRATMLLAEIDRTRGEMDRTLSAIEQRLSPQQLVNQGLDYVRRSGAADFARNLGDSARQNPLPVALTGIGIAWLMALGRRPAERDDDRSATDKIGEEVAAVKHRVGDRLGSIRESASATGATVTEASRRQWDRARHGFDYLVQEQPLLLGAIGLAVGAALGASTPRTRQEEQLLGAASRQVADKAKELGGEQLARARDAVEEAMNSAGQSTGANT